MIATDYRDALLLLEKAIELIEARRVHRRELLHRRLRRLSVDTALLRVRLRQAPAFLQRN
jgi:hypothetical protein